MKETVYSVSQVNKYIKMTFEKDILLQELYIKGEVTNLKIHSAGHYYFTIKDNTSSMRCIMFKNYADKINFKLKDGMSIIVFGQVTSYEREGTYQINIWSIEPDGMGSLYLEYEQLKEKLEKEGLFRKEYKKNLPFLPKRVGVITSKTGAVVKDIINVTTRRFKNTNLIIFPAAVQGDKTAKTVTSGIRYFNMKNNVDVIIIARGGGSFEDLFGFNDENLAREIFKSKIPVISAVGHETDFTICDFVSDLRAPTPSAAAELVYPSYIDILEKVNSSKSRLNRAITGYIQRKRQFIEKIEAIGIKRKPLEIISQNKMLIDRCNKNMIYQMDNIKDKKKMLLQKDIALLDSFSPLKTLTRGYSLVENHDGKVIKSVNDIKSGDNINIILLDGEKQAIVE